MIEKKRFVTLFPECTNIELLKDVGMIPYTLYSVFEYDSTIACYNNGKYAYLNHEVKGMKLDFINKIFGNMVLDTLLYVIRNARKIEVLNIYHLSVGKRFIWYWIYKMLNPNGIVYLKLDMDFHELDRLEADRAFHHLVKKKCLSKIEIVSAESKEICKRVTQLYGQNIQYIPNGFYEDKERSHPMNMSKQNVFLTVGRLGTEQKATEVLLEAFARTAQEHDWILRLVGPIQEEFQNYIDTFMHTHIELIDRIQFTGAITDREKLADEYARAKVFVLPSRWESFGIVLVEALNQGCYLIVSDAVPTAEDITYCEKYGEIFEQDSVTDLSEALLQCTKGEWNPLELREYAQEHFSWNTICSKLNHLILEAGSVI